MARLWIGGVLVASLWGCSSESAEVFMEARWQVRCQENGGCVNVPLREVVASNGDGAHRIDCTVNRTTDGNQLLTFLVFNGNDYGLELSSAVVTPGGGPIMGNSCIVGVLEEGRRHEGSCTSNPPTPGAPCRVSDIQITGDAGDRIVTGGILCDGIPAVADRGITRELTAPGSDPSVFSTPATFRFENCN